MQLIAELTRASKRLHCSAGAGILMGSPDRIILDRFSISTHTTHRDNNNTSAYESGDPSIPAVSLVVTCGSVARYGGVAAAAGRCHAASGPLVSVSG